MAIINYFLRHLLIFAVTKEKFERKQKPDNEIAEYNDYCSNIIDKIIRTKQFWLKL